jgi:Mg2+-importing ATPase
MNDARSAEPRLVDLARAARHPPGDVLAVLGSTLAGLASASAAEGLALYGPNVLDTSKVTTLDILVRQLRNPLLILLLSAAGVPAATGDVTDVRVGDVIPADVRRLFAEGPGSWQWPPATQPTWTHRGRLTSATCASPASSPSSTGAKADAGASIAKLNQLRIAVEIITGDNGTVAAKVCRDIGLTVEQVLTAPRNIAEDAVVTRASISSLRRTRRIRRNAARSISLSAAKITTPPSAAVGNRASTTPATAVLDRRGRWDHRCG